MKWFLDLAIRVKLLLGFGIMIILLAVIFLTSYSSVLKIRAFQKNVFEKEFTNDKYLKDVRFNQNKIRTAAVTMLLIKERNKLEALFAEGNKFTNANDELIKDLLEREKGTVHASKLEEFETLRQAFKETREKDVMPLIFAGKHEEAKKLITTVQAERNRKMGVIIDELVYDGEKEVMAAISASSNIMTKLVRLLVLLGLAALLIGISLALYMNRIIAIPLKEVTETAERMASGDLTVVMSSGNRRDEVGALTRSFTRMMQYLRDMSDAAGQIASGDLTIKMTPVSEKDVFGNAFAKMVENLKDINRNIRDASNALASSVSEILATTTQVASGMSETATSVSETTATVEEVKQTVLLSSEKFRGVADNAQRAAQVARQGNDAVTDTVEGINHIRGLMESVAASIVKLSEQTQAIGEIITTVNDLAQQSNLLSVNAAIEASKAGEHGKGFTVVAQEIKSLADQSKQATEQVRTILSDIQKATGAAVMAAEQVSKAVDSGVKQSNEAGQSISKLSESISEAAQTAIQIAASSQQQLAGMEQVALAMENIKQATQQNVAGTRQAEQTAHNLNELGQKLKGMVESYRV